MKLTILEKKDNPIFSRTEIKFKAEHEKKATPSRSEVASAVCANVKSDEELVSITSVKSSFGSAKSIGSAHIYKKKEDLEKFEPAHLIKRAKGKETVKAEEKPAETQAPAESAETAKESAEEKPAEEKKEEASE